MKMDTIIRCNNCPRAHKIIVRRTSSTQSVDFICRCGNKVSGTLEGENWNFNNASFTELQEDEPVYIHEPELK